MLRSWAGLHVATPDRRPLCGKVPGLENVFLLTGDNGFGLMRGLALGQRVAQAMAGNEPSQTSPSRFPSATIDFEMREGFHWAE